MDYLEIQRLSKRDKIFAIFIRYTTNKSRGVRIHYVNVFKGTLKFFLSSILMIYVIYSAGTCVPLYGTEMLMYLQETELDFQTLFLFIRQSLHHGPTILYSRLVYLFRLKHLHIHMQQKTQQCLINPTQASKDHLIEVFRLRMHPD